MHSCSKSRKPACPPAAKPSVWRPALRAWWATQVAPICFIASLLDIGRTYWNHEPLRGITLFYLGLSLVVLFLSYREARPAA